MKKKYGGWGSGERGSISHSLSSSGLSAFAFLIPLTFKGNFHYHDYKNWSLSLCSLFSFWVCAKGISFQVLYCYEAIHKFKVILWYPNLVSRRFMYLSGFIKSYRKSRKNSISSSSFQ